MEDDGTPAAPNFACDHLARIATHILAFEGDSQAVFFPGNYQEYEADKKKRLGEEGAKPKRIRYKPISR